MRIDWLYKLYLFENNDNNEVFLIIYKLFNFISRSLRRYWPWWQRGWPWWQRGWPWWQRGWPWWVKCWGWWRTFWQSTNFRFSTIDEIEPGIIWSTELLYLFWSQSVRILTLLSF